MKDIFLLALPGLILAFCLSLFSYWVSTFHPVLDAFFLAFVFSIVVGALIPRKEKLWVGLGLCKDIFIPLGLFLYGTQILWQKVLSDLSVMGLCLLNLVLYSFLIFGLNRVFGVKDKVSLLTGPANGICGISATAVFIPFVQAREREISATLTSLFLVGLLSLGVLLSYFSPRLPERQYGILSGSVLNQTGLVKAATAPKEKQIRQVALTTKYFRTSLIIPVSLLLFFVGRALSRESISPGLRRKNLKYALFLASLFFGASLIVSFTPLGEYQKSIKPVFKVLFSMTLVSVGLLCDVKKALTRDSFYNFLSNVVAFFVVLGVSYLLLHFGLV